MSKELLNHLVRNMISNMKSACQKHPIEKMAKALCRKYPCLKRLNNDENPLTEEEKSILSELGKSQLHVSDNLV